MVLIILKKREDACKEYSIKTVTQYNYVSGKNTSDSSLIIDAMDILYTKAVDSFYILSSDSDFTGIITRLKEENKRVIGIGEKKTPKSIISLLDKHIQEINNINIFTMIIGSEFNYG